MTQRHFRLFLGSLLLAATSFFITSTAAAVPFTVHGYDLGERIELTSGRRVWTAELDVTLGTEKGTSFCVDLDTYISTGTYETRSVLDAYTSPSPTDEAPRNFAWAGHVMDTFGKDLTHLIGGAISRDHAITGVQAAIWEGIYGGGIVDANSMSNGARSVFDQIMANQFGTPNDGTALIVELRGNQDQVFSNPVPEPTAAMVFGVGMLIMSKAVRRKE